ncbi:hypothetical protein, partial [Pseudomonas viridiflava]|uniref:hypothetical protein n=1 Tax=Pseudomonas viridiflava TaxID=33069 RepID=UPI00197E1D90
RPLQQTLSVSPVTPPIAAALANPTPAYKVNRKLVDASDPIRHEASLQVSSGHLQPDLIGGGRDITEVQRLDQFGGALPFACTLVLEQHFVVFAAHDT